MTKELSLNNTQIEVKAWDKIALFLTENDILKWLVGGLVSIVLFCTKIFVDYFKKRNKKIDGIDDLKRKVKNLESGQAILKEDIASVKKHNYRQHDQEMTLLNKIDKKLPDEIWDEITK